MFLQITQEILIVASQKSEDIALGEKKELHCSKMHSERQVSSILCL